MELQPSFEAHFNLLTESLGLCKAQVDDIIAKYKIGRAPANAPFKLFDINCNTSCDDQSEDDSKSQKKIRGPYRKYTVQEKMKAVERIQNGQDVKIISRQYGIPRRNLLRWKRDGCERKYGKSFEDALGKLFDDKQINVQKSNSEEFTGIQNKMLDNYEQKVQRIKMKAEEIQICMNQHISDLEASGKLKETKVSEIRQMTKKHPNCSFLTFSMLKLLIDKVAEKFKLKKKDLMSNKQNKQELIQIKQ